MAAVNVIAFPCRPEVDHRDGRTSEERTAREVGWSFLKSPRRGCGD